MVHWIHCRHFPFLLRPGLDYGLLQMGTQLIRLLKFTPRLGQNGVHIVSRPVGCLVEFFHLAHFHVSQASSEERTLGGCHGQYLQPTVEAATAAGANASAAKCEAAGARHFLQPLDEVIDGLIRHHQHDQGRLLDTDLRANAVLG